MSDARDTRHVAGDAGRGLQGEYQGAHAGTSEGNSPVPGRTVTRTLDFFITIYWCPIIIGHQYIVMKKSNVRVTVRPGTGLLPSLVPA